MTRDASILADIHRMLTEDRQRVRETQSDDRLNRVSAENALDLSRAIFMQEIMELQNRLIVEMMLAGLVGIMIDAITQVMNADPTGDTEVEQTHDPSGAIEHALDEKVSVKVEPLCRYCGHTRACHAAVATNDSSDPECSAKGTPCTIYEEATSDAASDPA